MKKISKIEVKEVYPLTSEEKKALLGGFNAEVMPLADSSGCNSGCKPGCISSCRDAVT